MTRRRSSYRSLASLQRDNRALPRMRRGGVCDRVAPRARGARGTEGVSPGPGARLVEGEQRRPWRGRAGQTLRRWLGLDEDAFYATFYCASVTRCYPGRASAGGGDRTSGGARAGAVLVLARVGAPVAAAAADRPGGRARDPAAARLVEPRRRRRAVLRARRGGRRSAPAPVGREPLDERRREPARASSALSSSSGPSSRR